MIDNFFKGVFITFCVKRQIYITEYIGTIVFIGALLLALISSFYFIVDADVGKNIFYLLFIIGLLIGMTYLFVRLLLFMIPQNALSKDQLKKIIGKKSKLQKELSMIFKKDSARYTARDYKIISELVSNEKFYNSGVVIFRSYIIFFMFSIILGCLYLSSPVWTLKKMYMILTDSMKYENKALEKRFAWRKMLVNNTYEYYPFSLEYPRSNSCPE